MTSSPKLEVGPIGVKDARAGRAAVTDEVVIRVPTADIIPMPNQPREWFDPAEIENLAESIKVNGQRTPVQVIELPTAGKYQLKSGERRLRAGRKIEEETGQVFLMRAIVEPSHGVEQDFEDAVVENLNRENMLPLETAASLHRLRERNKRTIADLAKMTGKSVSYVENYLALHQLPDIIKALMHPTRPKGDRLRVSAAFEIARIKDPDLQFEVADHVVNARLTVRDTSHLIESKARERGVDVYDIHTRKRERKPSDDRSMLESFMTRTAAFIGRAEKRMDFEHMYSPRGGGIEALNDDLQRLDIVIRKIDGLKAKMAATKKV